MFGLMVVKGLADNVLSDYLWARAILLVGEEAGRCGALPASARSRVCLLRASRPSLPDGDPPCRGSPPGLRLLMWPCAFVGWQCPQLHRRMTPCSSPSLPAGPTIATAGLALQVPLAVLLDALLRSPAWLSHAGSAVLTMLGGAIVLVGFFGVNAAGEDDEKTRHVVWEERQQVGDAHSDALQRARRTAAASHAWSRPSTAVTGS